jgi:5-methylthioadenosine/S-adenosylhomocysteine deaminase
MRTLFRGGHVRAKGRPELLDGGELLVEGDSIAALGRPGELAGEPVDRTIDAGGSLVLPGLMNTHQHDWYLYGKGLGGDLLLEQWISDCLFPLKGQLGIDDLRVASELAALDMIRGGTTTAVNHLVNKTTPAEEEAILGPVATTGMRQYFAKVIRREGHLRQLAHRRRHDVPG